MPYNKPMISEEMREFLRSVGRKGGEATKKNKGKDYYKKLGVKGMAKRWKNHKKSSNI